ncbi:MAG: hypothetical protein R3C11_04820 [Planctomycetaceae bacterium]
MTLESGQRLPGLRWSHYQINQLKSGEKYSPLYAGSKILFNHRYDEQEFYEVESDEWLPVWIRTTLPSKTNDADETQSRIKLLRYEMDAVLTAGSPWTPEPLDWLEYPQEKPAEPTAETSPAPEFPPAALVFSQMRGEPLSQAITEWPEDSLMRVRFLTEWLNFLDFLHSRNQCLGAISPDEILVDRSGHFQLLATDRILPISQTEHLRWFFPPDRYPAAYAAPEIQDTQSGFSPACDLYNWACLALLVFGGINLSERSSLVQEPLSSEELKKLTEQLQKLTSRYMAAMKTFAPGRFGQSEQLVVEIWKTAIQDALKLKPQDRPSSVNELRNVPVAGLTVQKMAERVKSWFRPVERRPE